MFGLSTLWTKAIAVGAAILAVLAAIGGLLRFGKKAGRAEVRGEIVKETEVIREKWDENRINRPTVDGALDELRRGDHR